MAMKVKAVEKLLKFDKNSAGVYRYVMSPEMYSVARDVLEPEPEEGNQGGRSPLGCEPGCDAGLLGCSRRGDQGVGH